MLNKVFLMGRLTKDPEIRYSSDNNLPVARFTLAVDRRFAKKGEERQADFINCVAFSKTAEFVNSYFVKGKMMILVGRIQTRNWEDQEGKKHYITEIVAEEINFADSKGSNNEGVPNGRNVEEDNGFFPIDGDDELPF